MCMTNYKIAVATLACVMVVVATPAQAATVTEALARMDALILEMQKLRAEFALLAKSTASAGSTTGAVLGATTAAVLTDDLSFGATNDSITRIQKLLATDSEIYADGTISGFFGPKTQDALRRFQTRFGLDPVGVVGPSTKAILEAFMAKYPNDTYPAGVLKGGVPQVAGATTAPALVVTPTPAPVASAQTSRIASITFEEDDGEVVVYSRNNDGTRNRDLIIYPEDEDELVEEVAAALKITEAAVRAIADLDDVRFGRDTDEEEEEADDALNDAEDAIDDAEEAIDAADEDGENTDDAEELLDEAYDALDDAEDAYDDGDYDDAIEFAEEAHDLAKDAIDEL
jgi:peptidoglycan hydrolase-like protein with peptidoglycan-binding domain